MADKWIGGAIKHPGAVKNAAKKRGRSVAQEAEAEAKSPDKKIAARGRLAMRLKGLAKKGNIRKAKSKRKKKAMRKKA